MPVLYIDAPPRIRPEAKRKLREYPAENVAMDGRLQSENPKILEALKKIGAGAWVRIIVRSVGPYERPY